MNEPFINMRLPLSWLIHQILTGSRLGYRTSTLYKSILIQLFQKNTFLQIQN